MPEIRDTPAILGDRPDERAVQDAGARRYEERRYAVAATADYHQRLIRSLVGLLSEANRSGRILDAGCGTGFLSVAWPEARPRHVAIDLSRQMLSYARARIDRLAQANAGELPFRDASFSAVVARGLLHHLPDVRAGAAELARVLRPGGQLVAIDPHATAPSQWVRRIVQDPAQFSADHRAFTTDELRSALDEHFDVTALVPNGFIAFPALALPDVVDFVRFLPAPRKTARLLETLDDFLARVPLVNRLSWNLIVVASRK